MFLSVCVNLICSLFHLPSLPAEKNQYFANIYIYSVSTFFDIGVIITWTADSNHQTSQLQLTNTLSFNRALYQEG